MKGWALFNKNTGKIIEIDVERDVGVLVFSTKRALMECVIEADHDEEIKRVEIR